jgi:hypothetical protein
MSKVLLLAFATMTVVIRASAQESMPNEADAIRPVILGYFEAFPRDSAAAAGFYGEPAFTVQPDSVVVLATRADVEKRSAFLLQQLKGRGYSTTKKPELRIRMLNARTALCGTVAIRMKTDGTELERVGYTYLLHKDSEGWRIHEVIATDIDRLINPD